MWNLEPVPGPADFEVLKLASVEGFKGVQSTGVEVRNMEKRQPRQGPCRLG